MRRRPRAGRPALALTIAALVAAPAAIPQAGAAGGPTHSLAAVGNADRGRAAFERLGCGVCHRIGSVPGAIGIVGPPLDGFAGRPLIAGSLPNRGDVLLRFIADPPALVPATGMPAVPATDEEIRDIAAFLATLD